MVMNDQSVQTSRESLLASDVDRLIKQNLLESGVTKQNCISGDECSYHNIQRLFQEKSSIDTGLLCKFGKRIEGTYQEKLKHLLMPIEFVGPKGLNLCDWMEKNRHRFAKNPRHKVISERQDLNETEIKFLGSASAENGDKKSMTNCGSPCEFDSDPKTKSDSSTVFSTENGRVLPEVIKKCDSVLKRTSDPSRNQLKTRDGANSQSSSLKVSSSNINGTSRSKNSRKSKFNGFVNEGSLADQIRENQKRIRYLEWAHYAKDCSTQDEQHHYPRNSSSEPESPEEMSNDAPSKVYRKSGAESKKSHVKGLSFLVGTSRPENTGCKSGPLPDSRFVNRISKCLPSQLTNALFCDKQSSKNRKGSKIQKEDGYIHTISTSNESRARTGSPGNRNPLNKNSPRPEIQSNIHGEIIDGSSRNDDNTKLPVSRNIQDASKPERTDTGKVFDPSNPGTVHEKIASNSEKSKTKNDGMIQQTGDKFKLLDTLDLRMDETRPIKIIESIPSYVIEQKSTSNNSGSQKCAYKQRLDINTANILKVYEKLRKKPATFSEILLDELAFESSEDLRYYCTKILQSPDSFLGNMKNQVSKMFNCCNNGEYDDNHIASVTSCQVMDYLIGYGILSKDEWRTFTLKNDHKTIIQYCEEQVKTLDLTAYDPISLFEAVVSYCRQSLQGLIDLKLFNRQESFFSTPHYRKAKALIHFRDLSFSKSKRDLLNRILKFLKTQIVNQHHTGMTFERASELLIICMTPAQYLKDAVNITTGCKFLWFDSLLKQGEMVYMPKWAEDFDITAAPRHIEFVKIL